MTLSMYFFLLDVFIKLLFCTVKNIITALSTYFIQANIYLFKVNSRSSRKKCEIRSKLTLRTPETTPMKSLWCFYYLISIFDFELVKVSWDSFRGTSRLKGFQFECGIDHSLLKFSLTQEPDFKDRLKRSLF